MARSKRKSSEDATGTKAVGKKRKVAAEEEVVEHSVFKELVTSVGFVLKTANKPNELTKDQGVFIRSLGTAVKRHADFPNVVDDMLEGLRQYIESHVRLRWSLMPTITPVDSDSTCSGTVQDSLLRLLLRTDVLQSKVLGLLLERLAEFSGDEDVIFDDTDKVNLPHMILNQMRWLDRLVDSQELVEKMFEILTVTSDAVQREIIACLPEVIEDPQHHQVALQLQKLLAENNTLASPILDTLTNLNLSSTIVAEIRSTVLDSLESVALEDLPVVVKFLLHTVSPEDALLVVSELRAKLDLPSSLQPGGSSTSNQHAKGVDGNSSRCTTALTVEALRSAIRFHRATADAWIKAIENVTIGGDHKREDILMLLLLHTSGHRRPVESLLRHKLRAGLISDALLESTITTHTTVLREYFPSILSLAEVLLRSPEESISQFGAAIYGHAFVSFDAYCKQELVGNLVTHIGSGVSGEVQVALDVLLKLSQKHVVAMAPYAIFIKGVLDYLDHLDMGQIRKLYQMLSCLAFCDSQDQSMIQDEIYILIRKQLTHNDPKYQHMGVIGAVMVVKCLGSKSDSRASAGAGSSHTDAAAGVSGETFNQVVTLLQLVRTSAARSPHAAALFMDELAGVVTAGTLDPKVESWVAENVIGDFQDDFVIDIDPNIQEGESILPWTMQYALDDENEGAIAINLFPLLAKAPMIHRMKQQPAQIQSKHASPLCLSPQFRLLQMCESQQNTGDLEGIDALLGCPVSMPSVALHTKLSSLSHRERELLCDGILLTVNWFRELVNAFASQGDAEMKGKVVSRIQNITQLIQILHMCLHVVPNYLPPPAYFDQSGNKPLTVATAAASGKGKAGRKAGGKGKRKSADSSKDSDDEADPNVSANTTSTQLGKTTQAEVPAVKHPVLCDIDLARYRPYVREFDLSVFSILSVGLITRTALDTELNPKSVQTLQLRPAELCVLLEDLAAKLHRALPSKIPRRRNPFGNSVCHVGFNLLDQKSPLVVAKQTTTLLPALCDHLDAMAVFFQTLSSANDEMIDGPTQNTPEARLMGQCCHLLLQCLLSVFSWVGFSITEHRPLLKEALAVLACRFHSSTSSQAALSELMRQSFGYIENLCSMAPTLGFAVSLCKLLTVLASLHQEDSFTDKIALLSEGFLKRDWLGADGERARGAAHNEHLQTLLKMVFTNSENVLDKLESLSTVGMAELINTEKNGFSDTYPTLTRNSFSVFYKALLLQLVQSSKGIPAPKTNDNTQVLLERLLQWNMAVRIFHVLVNLIKVFDQRSNLGAVLKSGRMLVEVFLRNGMPLLDRMFRSHSDSVQSLLKNLQLSTRVLQHMCGHSKIIRDVSLTNQVPGMKKALEGFVYRVKAMLTVNNCLEAFWLGNLKNRDLQGEEILSQSTTIQGSDQEESDNEDVLPESDSDSDVQSVSSHREQGGRSPRQQSDGEDSDDSAGQSYSETF